jgi:hypothetical protein
LSYDDSFYQVVPGCNVAYIGSNAQHAEESRANSIASGSVGWTADNFSDEDLASSSSSVQGLFSAGNRLYRFQIEDDNEYEKYALLMVPLMTVEPSGAVWAGYGWEVAECVTRDKIPQAITEFCARSLSLVAPEFLDEDVETSIRQIIVENMFVAPLAHGFLRDVS